MRILTGAIVLVAALALVLTLTMNNTATAEDKSHEGHDHAAHAKATTQPAEKMAHHMGGHAKAWSGITKLVATMHPTAGSTTKGTVTFSDSKDGVVVTATISGLTPGAKHAIHIHEFGDTTDPSGKSAGGHFNPEGHDHALPTSEKRHAGDLGNLTADDKGNASYTITVTNISLIGIKNPIIGRGVIVHADVDDGGQPTGNAGARIAAGVIGIAKH